MISKTAKVQPYKSEDADIDTLVSFLRRVAKLLDDIFEPSTIIQDDSTESEPYDYVERTYKLGSEDAHFAILHRMEFEAKYGGHAVDIVRVACEGLVDDQSVSIEVARRYSQPRYAEITLRCSDGEKAEKILRLFKEEFDARSQLDEKDIKSHLTSALIAIKRRAWSGAEAQAKIVLDYDPSNVEALFYLGIARAAQGDLQRAEEILTDVIDRDPSNYDAYYNLGLVYKNTERVDEAIKLYEKGLCINPDNHALQFQLARAHEEAGNKEQALFYYREALRTSPNPDGAFHFTGMDFTDYTKEAIERLEKELAV
ncbi:MAG: hypothetical protein BAJATHORv1_60119 [Candidatus Thorarchaeota archaeon]|nr:MAG: hypothetical protein BAJATHORv1_60119 [Candidatus Thorarchaeota archaeon]